MAEPMTRPTPPVPVPVPVPVPEPRPGDPSGRCRAGRAGGRLSRRVQPPPMPGQPWVGSGGGGGRLVVGSELAQGISEDPGRT